MKKFLSLFVAFVLGATLVSAKTIYCKMEQGWWKTDGAAVGCHSWGTPGPGTTWPGVRMTPVEGETDLWSIELDTDKVQNVIFTRVNPSGAIADWGAKTKDLQIPTDDKNLFTITTSKAVWGDPGCEGEWSVYGGAVEKPKHDYTITAYLPEFCDAIAAYADSARVMGGFDDWSNGIWMEKKIDEDFNDCWYAEIHDVEEGTAFKLRFGTDADWKVQVQLNGANMANEAFGETTDIVLHYDGEGYGFAACAQPVEHKFYVTGNAALVGEEKAWQADAIEMVDNTHTFSMLAAGEYQLKVTDGTWEHAWGYDNLSPTVAVEGLYTDVDGNICFTVYTPNDVTVTFAQGYVVVTGDFKGTGTNLNKVKAAQGQRYNILGQPVKETYQGIVIMNGQTYLQ